MHFFVPLEKIKTAKTDVTLKIKCCQELIIELKKKIFGHEHSHDFMRILNSPNKIKLNQFKCLTMCLEKNSV